MKNLLISIICYRSNLLSFFLILTFIFYLRYLVKEFFFKFPLIKMEKRGKIPKKFTQKLIRNINRKNKTKDA